MKILNLRTNSSEEMRKELKEYLDNTFFIEEELYKVLKNNDTFYMRADPLRHPLIFYYGHTCAFYMNKLILAGLISERINPEIESVSAVGVDEMSWDDLNEEHYNWPQVSEVRQFRKEVQDLLHKLIDEMPLEMPIDWNSPWWSLIMGMEHQRIHIETSSVLIRQLPIDEVVESSFFPTCEEFPQAPKNELVNVLGGEVILGKKKSNPYYGWDNEFGYHKAEIKNMKVSRYLVSNKEYLEFVEAKGYEEESYWTEEGWGWISYTKAKYPLFWIHRDGKWYQRNMTNIIEMPWSWPVEVNYLEAKAFCNWKSKVTGDNYRMPTEDEWYQMYEITGYPDIRKVEKTIANINFEDCASSVPVNKYRSDSLYDVIGNVWQWTEVPIYAFKGFDVHPWYDDFTTPTYDGQHNLIKGGSWASTGNLAIPESRYAFRRHFYQHAGFRYLKSDEPVVTYNNIYEEDPIVVAECERGWEEERFGIRNISLKLSEIAFDEVNNMNKAMVIGCGTGRTVFELAKKFDYVEGLDNSARTFKMAVELQQKGHIHYISYNEGENSYYNEKYLANFGLENTVDKVQFYQADPSNLLPKFTGYDLIISEMMLNKTYAPKKFLETLASRINKDGILIIANYAKWKDSVTTKENWLGGYRGEDGEIVESAMTIQRIIEKDFKLVKEPRQLSYIIPIDNYTSELRNADITVWKKK
jgi:5-histidylcysteine sulfoxide synthase/putative 4-mercaptohistidine N1-methyltranferase